MRDFFGEYGFAIISVTVAIALIVMSTPIGDSIKRSVINVVESASSKAKRLYGRDDNKTFVKLSQIGTSGLFDVIITSDSIADTFSLEYQVKNATNNWSSWRSCTNSTWSEGSHDHKTSFIAEIESGNSIKVRAKNLGKEDELIYYSEEITYVGSTSAEKLIIKFDDKNNNGEIDNGDTFIYGGIKVRCLKVEGNKMFVISDDTLATKTFDVLGTTNKYEDSDLDRWMNSFFINNMHSDERVIPTSISYTWGSNSDKSETITRNVFALSLEESQNTELFPSNESKKTGGEWWTRTGCKYIESQAKWSVYTVSSSGTSESVLVDNPTSVQARPAFYISTSKINFSKK